MHWYIDIWWYSCCFWLYNDTFKFINRKFVPWRRERLPTPVFWPEEFHGLQSMGSQRVGHAEWLHFHFSLSCIGEMATHSSVLAWRIPRMGETCGLPFPGSHRVGHDWSDLAAATAAYTLLSNLPWFTHSSVLAWIISGMAEPGRLPSVGSHRVGHD